MHNSEQQNAQERFNAGQVNAASQFNAEMKNNREQFNAQNQLVVDQSNATWRREIATQDTAAINRANELNASTHWTSLTLPTIICGECMVIRWNGHGQVQKINKSV